MLPRRAATDGLLAMTLDDARSHIRVTHDGETLSVRHHGATFRFDLPDPMAHAEAEDESGGRLIAPLPGQVTQVLGRARGGSDCEAKSWSCSRR